MTLVQPKTFYFSNEPLQLELTHVFEEIITFCPSFSKYACIGTTPPLGYALCFHMITQSATAYSMPCSSVYIVDFEQLNAGWVPAPHLA